MFLGYLEKTSKFWRISQTGNGKLNLISVLNSLIGLFNGYSVQCFAHCLLFTLALHFMYEGRPEPTEPFPFYFWMPQQMRDSWELELGVFNCSLRRGPDFRLCSLKQLSLAHVFHLWLLCSVSDITAAALATGACIVGILCLPLILILIYKQRQAVNSRRMYQNVPILSLLPFVTFISISHWQD